MTSIQHFIYSSRPFQFSLVPLDQSCPTLCNPMNCSTPDLTKSQRPSKPKSIVLVMPSNHLIFCGPLLLLSSIFPSIRVFSNESIIHITWPKYWSLSFNISPSNKHPGLISFRMFGCISLQSKGLSTTELKSINLQHSAFFIAQLSHPYITTGKTIALTKWTFFHKLMSLLFNLLSRLVISFLPRSKCLWIFGFSHHLQWFGRPEK